MTDETLFLSNLRLIDDVVAHVCRRHRLSAAEAEDFAGEVRLHFIERDYEPLRKFKGQCTLRTYLNVLVQHAFYDYRNRLWGKWRPSAEAKRIGPDGILLERLVTRDGLTIDQVRQTLETNHGITFGAALEGLCTKLAHRQPHRQIVTEQEAEAIESPAGAPDENIVRAEQDFYAKRAYAALDRAKQTLDADARLTLKMRYEEGVSVADIARAFGVNQKKLYRTIEKILTKLRVQLEADGLSKDEITALFATGALSPTDRDDDEPGGGAGAAPAPITNPRTPWLTKQ